MDIIFDHCHLELAATACWFAQVTSCEAWKTGFTAHNIRLPDGSCTAPEIGWLTADSPWFKAAARVVRLIYAADHEDKSLVDLGCLEGGYTVEFARMGLQATGIEVRQSNFENCLIVQDKVRLPNLRFCKDDVWNLPRHGHFSTAFCCGLLYHLDRPAAFVSLSGSPRPPSCKPCKRAGSTWFSSRPTFSEPTSDRRWKLVTMPRTHARCSSASGPASPSRGSIGRSAAALSAHSARYLVDTVAHAVALHQRLA